MLFLIYISISNQAHIYWHSRNDHHSLTLLKVWLLPFKRKEELFLITNHCRSADIFKPERKNKHYFFFLYKTALHKGRQILQLVKLQCPLATCFTPFEIPIKPCDSYFFFFFRYYHKQWAVHSFSSCTSCFSL